MQFKLAFGCAEKLALRPQNEDKLQIYTGETHKCPVKVMKRGFLLVMNF